MLEPKKNCPKCEGIIDEGYILDSGHGNMKRLPTWIAGKPDKSFWAGGLKTNDKKQFDVKDFRCIQCGFIESYATRERINNKK